MRYIETKSTRRKWQGTWSKSKISDIKEKIKREYQWDALYNIHTIARESSIQFIHAIHMFPNLVLTHVRWTRRIVSEYDQEIPQSQTADKPMAPRAMKTRDGRKSLLTLYQIINKHRNIEKTRDGQ